MSEKPSECRAEFDLHCEAMNIVPGAERAEHWSTWEQAWLRSRASALDAARREGMEEAAGIVPRDLSVEALARWLAGDLSEDGWRIADGFVKSVFLDKARAVRSLIEEKVKEAVVADRDDAAVCSKGDGWVEHDSTVNELVSRIMGHP